MKSGSHPCLQRQTDRRAAAVAVAVAVTVPELPPGPPRLEGSLRLRLGAEPRIRRGCWRAGCMRAVPGSVPGEEGEEEEEFWVREPEGV